MMSFCVALLAVCLLVTQWQLLRVNRRLVCCENYQASVEILADQVCELCGDFYGPRSE